MVLLLPLAMTTERGVPLREISVRGSVDQPSRQIRGSISTSVPTPVGKVPVNGRVVAEYTCEGAFAGTVSYAFLVRLAAKVKRVELVNRLDGRVIALLETECVRAAEVLSGRFSISDGTLSGYVRVDEDSLGVQGTVRAVGDDGYHAELRPTDGQESYSVVIDLYER
jgi:hypothetical protein